MTFKEKLLNAAQSNNSWLCVGLDPDISKIPEYLRSGAEPVLEFNRKIIEAVSNYVCAFKPNSAFYESLGEDGWRILKNTIDYIPENIPVILDFKRSDIGNTAAMYAKSAFECFNADAVTVSPYLGFNSIEPFIKYKDRGVIILCLTSNKSSSDFQKQIISGTSENSSLYARVAQKCVEWNSNDNVGLVVGATSPGELKEIRDICGPEMPILIPGVGAQGGDLEKSIEYGSNGKGQLAIINVSRAVLYAGDDDKFDSAASAMAKSYRDQIARAVKNKVNTA